jgi:diacylglycerol O-acyltransferase
MERLTGLDAAFLAMESPAHPMHTLKLLVLEPLGNGGLFDALAPALLARLHLLPAFRRRVLEVPHGVHHPVWIEDPDFEISAHLGRITVPAPGGPAEVDAIVGGLAGVPLDRGRPLWALWVLEGLRGGRVALLVKVHHALADGVTVARLLDAVMTRAEGGEIAPPSRAWSPERAPSDRALLRSALRDHLGQAAHLPRLVQGTFRRLRALVQARGSDLRSPRPVLDAPSTSFNRALTERRSFCRTSLPLADVRAVKRAFGVTINDVILALASTALREYLLEEGALPVRSLIASVPTSSETKNAPLRRGGNHVSSLFVSLHTDLVDPVERLLAIHRGALAAKKTQALLGADLMESWAEYVPPRALGWALRGWARSHLANRVPPPLNVIVASVPGPTAPLFVPGHRLVEVASVGPLLEGIGVNITAWSYLDTVFVGVLSAPDLVRDPQRVASGMDRALAELEARIPR